MANIFVEGSVLTIKPILGKPESFDLAELRLNFLVTTQKMHWFVLGSKSEILSVDLDDENLREAIGLFAEAFRTEKAGALAGVNICLADYSDHRIVLGLNHFKKSSVDIFGLLKDSNKARVKKRESWLAGNPIVRLKGSFRQAELSQEGFSLSKNKTINWSEVAHVQLDVQDSLVKVVNLLLIPEGTSSGIFSLAKYKYALRGIPKKLSDLYLSECLFWMNLQKNTVESWGASTEAKILQEIKDPPAYAGLWRRLAAGLIDAALLLGLGILLSGGLKSIDPEIFINRRFSFIFMYPALLVLWLYFAVLESSVLQATIGKRILSLEVTDARQKRIGFGQASGRFFAKIVTTLTYGIGFLAIVWTKRKMALHDFMAGTLVVMRDQKKQ